MMLQGCRRCWDHEWHGEVKCLSWVKSKFFQWAFFPRGLYPPNITDTSWIACYLTYFYEIWFWFATKSVIRSSWSKSDEKSKFCVLLWKLVQMILSIWIDVEKDMDKLVLVECSQRRCVGCEIWGTKFKFCIDDLNLTILVRRLFLNFIILIGVMWA